MEFRDLGKQYHYNKTNIDAGIREVITGRQFIQGKQVRELEAVLSEYVGVKHCISCANGTDALQLVLMAWGIGKGDAVFVPDFTFFSTGEVVSAVGAVPVFVDVDGDTFNISCDSLENMIIRTLKKGKEKPRVIIAVNLFGQPADYRNLRRIADQYGLLILEDSAQGFGGRAGEKKAGAFGDASATSFFPAKPLGCYGDGGAVFTDNDDWAGIIESLRAHGKGASKYNHIRIGMNSRLDTIQAAVLLAKFPVFLKEELGRSAQIADLYTNKLMDVVKTPVIKDNVFSSWAQYTIQLPDSTTRDKLKEYLNTKEIPTAVYYPAPMHTQKAFGSYGGSEEDYRVTDRLCETVLSLPFHPYMDDSQIVQITQEIKAFLKKES